jgi:putative PIG3 family NAD(P)H quinone oxidoreductase
MRAVIAKRPGGVDVLEIVEVPAPEPGPEDLLVRNFAAALNRADLLQRRGLYPPPPGESEVLGLEFAGEVAEAGSAVEGFRRGDRVFGLVGGGAYAELVRVHHRLALPIPDTFSYEAAAACPEAFSISLEGLFALGELAAGQCAVVHAGASGVGTAAIQLARAEGAIVVATAGSSAKAEACRGLGAAEAVDYHEGDFAEATRRLTGGRGADLVFDLVGARHWAKSIDCLRDSGRLVLIGLAGGARVDADLGAILRKRLTILATTLRRRPLAEKIDLAARFAARVLPLLRSGEVKPLIDSIHPLEDVRAAHGRMEANLNAGKIILRL